MLTKVYGSAVFGVEATTITVEVNADKGIGYHLVGLPDKAISESSYRITAALKNVGYKMPGKKLILNLSPADLRKVALMIYHLLWVSSTLQIKFRPMILKIISSWENYL